MPAKKSSKSTSWNVPFGKGGTTRGTKTSTSKGYTQSSHTVSPTPSGRRRVTDTTTNATYGKPTESKSKTSTAPALKKARGQKAK